MYKKSEIPELIVSEKAEWMPCPKMEIAYPGLAYFLPLEQLIIAAKLDPLHEIIGKIDAGYTIFNTDGQKVFLAVQENKKKKFNLKVYNYYGNEIMELRKRFKLCLNEVHVWAPPGNFVGSIEQVRCCMKNFVVKNSRQKSVLKIQPRDIPYENDYNIYCGDEKVGLLTNRWKFRSILNVKSFGVSFPIFTSVEHKVMMLGASFLIGGLKY